MNDLTPLHLAVWEGLACGVVRMLFESGADANALDVRVSTRLQLALGGRHGPVPG